MNKQLIAAAIVAGSMMTSAAMAANDGTLGNTSNGDVDVNLTIPELVQLSFPNGDIDFTYTPGANATATEEFCVYSNQATIDFDITVAPTNVPSVGTDPVMTFGGNELVYQIDLDTAAGGSISADIPAAGVTVNDTTNANQSNLTCGGTNTHEFAVTVLEADIQGVTDGIYTDTIVVTIAAN